MKKFNLQSLGLSDEEILVYIILCQHSHQTIASLSKYTNIHRPRLYQILPNLLEKEIVKERPVGKRIKYVAVEPRELFKLLKEQQLLIAGELEELQGIYEKQTQKPDIEFFVGQQGYKKLFDDIADVVPKGEQILRYSARRPDDDDFKTSSIYRERRDKGHFERLSITSVEKGKKIKTQQFNKFTKIIPKNYDAFDDHVSQTIYADRVAFVDHEHETTFIIKSPKIAQVQKKLFKLLWKFLDEPTLR